MEEVLDKLTGKYPDLAAVESERKRVGKRIIVAARIFAPHHSRP